ncbi:MarR family winged helix-turn-helix transcriptional regulator [Paracoccus jeotgali]|nr:MarR family transcriptional regulator [Paracoccus jeotgali]
MNTFFPYRLAVAAEAFSRQLVEVYGRTYGLSREEWRLLFLLDDVESLDSLEVAQRTSLDKVQVSRAASKLEEKGLITREVHSTDRRLRRFAATPEGHKRFRMAFKEVERRAEEILGAIPEEERAALFRGIEALHRAATDRPLRDGTGDDAGGADIDADGSARLHKP